MTRSARLPRPKACSCSTTPRKAFGASYKGRRLGTFGLATATSFFPAKPLGCYGDGGAIFTDDASSPRRCAAFASTARVPTSTTMCVSA